MRLPVVFELLRARPGSVVCYLARRLEIEHRLIGRHTTLGLFLRHVARYLPGGAVSDCVEIENSGHFTDEWLLVVARYGLGHRLRTQPPRPAVWVSRAAISSGL